MPSSVRRLTKKPKSFSIAKRGSFRLLICKKTKIDNVGALFLFEKKKSKTFHNKEDVFNERLMLL
jgi:hypothetical protein